MTIQVYALPIEIDDSPLLLETHEWTGTLAGFFTSKGINYAAYETHPLHPIVVLVNGIELPVSQWETEVLTSQDDVRVIFRQYGGLFKGLGNIIGKLFNAVFGWMMPSAKGSDYRSPAQGRQLEVSQAKANQARLGDVVPELAGRFRRFPDYLTPPRRYFENRRVQWLEFLCCIGPGQYQINPEDVKVGETPLSQLGESAAYQIFGPGADLSGVQMHEHWHTVDEVGGTSSGTAGLELSTEIGNRENTDPAQYQFSGNVISRTEGQFPPAWGNGTVVDITTSDTQTYEVTRRAVPIANQVNVFSGNFIHLMPIGGQASFTGAVTGTYWIRNANLDAEGNGTIELWTREEDENEETGEVTVTWEPFNRLDPGSYTVGSSVTRRATLSSASEDTITVPVTFPSFTNPAQIKFVEGTVYGEWTSAFVICPGSETTDTIEFDVFFPGGLVYINDDASFGSLSVGVELQYRNVNGGPTVSIQRTYTEATNDGIGFTERLSVQRGNYVVRMRRIGARNTSSQAQDTCHWFGLKCRLRTRTSYPSWTTMSVRLRSGGKLAAQSENQINVIATRVLPTLLPDGTWSEPRPTRDISAFVGYIARTIGYTDEQIDMAELLRLHNLWTSRGETCDYVFDLTTVKEALNTVLRAGMAEFTVADGQIRPVRDGIRTTFEQSYSAQNMTGNLRRAFRGRRNDDTDGVEVEYTDAETWTQKTVICALPGSQRLKLEKLKLDGVTDRTRAWRIGMRRVREIEYQRWEYAFGTEMDAFNSEYGSYVALFDDVSGAAQSMLLEHIEPHAGGALLHVSEPLVWDDDKTHAVWYRRPDGTVAGPWFATPGPDEYSLIALMPQPWPEVTLKQELPHVYFGEAFPALIKQITPNGMDSASATAVNYDDRVYSDDDNFPPN